MKATRYEYMMYVREFLNKLEERDFATNDYLEISGNTPEWAKHYKNITTTSYPQVDAHNLPYADGSYDCVALNQVLEHVEKPWVVKAEDLKSKSKTRSHFLRHIKCSSAISAQKTSGFLTDFL